MHVTALRVRISRGVPPEGISRAHTENASPSFPSEVTADRVTVVVKPMARCGASVPLSVEQPASSNVHETDIPIARIVSLRFIVLTLISYGILRPGGDRGGFRPFSPIPGREAICCHIVSAGAYRSVQPRPTRYDVFRPYRRIDLNSCLHRNLDRYVGRLVGIPLRSDRPNSIGFISRFSPSIVTV